MRKKGKRKTVCRIVSLEFGFWGGKHIVQSRPRRGNATQVYLFCWLEPVLEAEKERKIDGTEGRTAGVIEQRA